MWSPRVLFMKFSSLEPRSSAAAERAVSSGAQAEQSERDTAGNEKRTEDKGDVGLAEGMCRRDERCRGEAQV